MAKCHILVDLSLKQGCDLCDKTKPLVYVGDDFRMNKYFFEKLLLAKNVNRRRIWVSSNQGPQWIETKTVETYFLIHSSSFLFGQAPQPEKRGLYLLISCEYLIDCAFISESLLLSDWAWAALSRVWPLGWCVGQSSGFTPSHGSLICQFWKWS